MNYDNNEFFNSVLNSLAPHGAIDSSYGNDAYPSVGICIDEVNEHYIYVFIAQQDKDLREYEDDFVRIYKGEYGDLEFFEEIGEFNLEKTLEIVEQLLKEMNK